MTKEELDELKQTFCKLTSRIGYSNSDLMLEHQELQTEILLRILENVKSKNNNG
jgi:hypothetical protein